MLSHIGSNPIHFHEARVITLTVLLATPERMHREAIAHRGKMYTCLTPKISELTA